MDEAKKAKEEARNHWLYKVANDELYEYNLDECLDIAQKLLLDKINKLDSLSIKRWNLICQRDKVIEQQKKEIEDLREVYGFKNIQNIIAEKDLKIKKLEKENQKLSDDLAFQLNLPNKSENKSYKELEAENAKLKEQLKPNTRGYPAGNPELIINPLRAELSLYKEAIDKINHWMQTDDWLKKLISMKILNVKNLSVKSYEEIEKLISALRKSDASTDSTSSKSAVQSGRSTSDSQKGSGEKNE